MAVQVWYAEASAESPGPLEADCRKALCAEETERATLFRKPTSANQFVVGRGMARRLLGAKLNCAPESIPFRFSPHGKPLLDSPQQLGFNVAHTTGMVLCAIGEYQQVGVDVESTGRKVDIRLAERYFAKSEVEWVFARPPAEQTSAFLKIWTLKESFIKAIGTGLTMPLDEFAFHDLESSQPTVRIDSDQHGKDTDWHAFVFQPVPGYVAALSVHDPRRPSFTTHPFES
ncbi:4'-phosphopantetheinyl transferase sfp [Roseimaritima multifibrata]|uniref:4'-phosphopantetheinyl transferase sfp n=1 Tax=Roseimaritima multifibrata TaxID=1930274 RepID=A0A517MFC8_9BACT|nr:4'-phosphopantetheinyl transferase superfamily protein [Roseimaritima multifibrata]QDS93457.1 4'-phosphopantetheinyl transferase sfp [Roseimaritima multifibrata]